MTEVIINPLLVPLMSFDDKGRFVTVTKVSSKEIEIAIDSSGGLKQVVKCDLHSKLLKEGAYVGSKWYITDVGGIASVVVPEVTKISTTTRNSSNGSLSIRSKSKLNI